MPGIAETIFYIVIFLSIYVQIFYLVTFFENRKKIVIRKNKIKLAVYPAVTIVVPCFNEERTVYKTVRSLLNLNYPKDKLKLILVNDGSTDGTWNAIRRFEKYSNITIFTQENGGKHTALNLGLIHTDTAFVGCLDADSLVDPEALVRIMSYFERDSENMAISPAVIVNEPKGILQSAQKIEYDMGIYFKKMLSFLGAINVTPGPFTIFRKKVFEDLGPYRFAHNAEDMEIAYRMQKNFYKIEQCNDAYVLTNTPFTVPKLFKQRLRWIYGFINNTMDYRGVILDKKYGNFSTFTLPTGIISIVTVSYFFGRVVYNIGDYVVSKILFFQTAGVNTATITQNFDPFFINIPLSLLISISIYCLVALSIIIGSNLSRRTRWWTLPFEMVYFLVVFSFLAPLWIMKALYNTALARAPAWR